MAGVTSDARARLLVMAIAGQESAWAERRQIGGPARSFWQFEGGPLSGTGQVFKHAGGPPPAGCAALLGPCDPVTVFEAMAWDDVLGAAMARLLLWTDPAELPAVGDVNAGWAYYQRNWHPGAPHADLWPARYGTAWGLVKA